MTTESTPSEKPASAKAHLSLDFDHNAGKVTVSVRRPLTKAEALNLASSLRWFATPNERNAMCQPKRVTVDVAPDITIPVDAERWTVSPTGQLDLYNQQEHVASYAPGRWIGVRALRA